MDTKNLILKQSQFITLERMAADCLLDAGNGDAALLYLYLLREEGELTPQKAANHLHKTQTWVEETLQTLIRLGLVQESSRKKPAKLPEQDVPAMPEYTNEEIAKELESDSPFPALVQETQRRLGRVLTTTDLRILFGIYDYLSLPAEVISLLVTYCAEENARRSGEGVSRPLRMRQVEREAYRWKRQGADTMERAEVHLKHLSLRQAAYGEIFQILQLEARAPSPSEQTYMDRFLDMGFSMEAIGLAYDKTMLQTGSLKWPYLNSILERWHQKNLHTLEEIKTGDIPEKTKKVRTSSAPPAQVNPQDQEAINWMKELVRRQKREE